MKIINGDSYDWLKKIPEDSVDSVVCDPPYLLNFIGIELDAEYCKIAQARIDAVEVIKHIYKNLK